MNVEVGEDEVRVSNPANPKLESVVSWGIELKAKKEATTTIVVTLALCLFVAFIERRSDGTNTTAAVLFALLGGAAAQTFALSRVREKFRKANQSLCQSSSESSDDEPDESEDEDDDR